MLSAKNVRFSYDAENSFKFPDFHCGAGEKKLILGSSGTGKTTLLHLLTGLIKPSSGDITLHGTAYSSLPNAKLDKFRGKHIGLVFQTSHFIQALSVRENLMMPLALNGLKADDERIMKLLERLQIKEKANSRVFNLSIGERQRVSIARALIHKPK